MKEDAIQFIKDLIKHFIAGIIIGIIGVGIVFIFKSVGIKIDVFSVSELIWIMIFNFLFILNYHIIVNE